MRGTLCGVHRRTEAGPALEACPRLLAWSMGWREYIIGDTHGVIPFRRVFTRRIPVLRCSFVFSELRSDYEAQAQPSADESSNPS